MNKLNITHWAHAALISAELYSTTISIPMLFHLSPLLVFYASAIFRPFPFLIAFIPRKLDHDDDDDDDEFMPPYDRDSRNKGI